MGTNRGRWRAIAWGLALGLGVATASAPAAARAQGGRNVSREEVEHAIRGGVAFLLKAQRIDGSWGTELGQSALVTLALLTAGESPRSAPMQRALEVLRKGRVEPQHETYTIALITMALAAADPDRYRDEIARYAEWLERGQTRSGAWSYNASAAGMSQSGDNSNTQYALLGLHAASEAGFAVRPEAWNRARAYWIANQGNQGGWGYQGPAGPTGSMTCAGISSLIITGLKRVQGREVLVNGEIRGCGQEVVNPNLQNGLDWMARNFDVTQNPGSPGMWKFYYLYGVERVGRLSGRRFFGSHDWYREGAAHLVRGQDGLEGFWRGGGPEGDPILTTSFALLFLAKGRAPVLVNKLRHGPGADWNNDHDDIANLVGVVSRDWKHLLTWQVVDPDTASIEDMLQAPIAYLNGHRAPLFSPSGEDRLREYVEQGGMIVAEACCGSEEFDRGFKALMEKIFPDPELALKVLHKDHAVWRARYDLTDTPQPLFGIEHGCRTVVIYSPDDLSCYWNQLENAPGHPTVQSATKIGQNIVDYATGREMPADKLAVRDIADFKPEQPRRGALRIAKIRHAGDWNIAPLAIPNLTTSLRDKLKFDVVINHKELFPRDPNLVHYPLIYLHGRGSVAFPDEDEAPLRRHLSPGGGTLFVDAACGSPVFDAAFRRMVAELLPNNPLVPIPPGDPFFTQKIGYDLSGCKRTVAAGGTTGFPELEGVKIDGRWAVIYSKLDLGCALQKQAGLDCKGYVHDSALKIATNIVIYSTLP
ncbi:DUF4159 domain-containing protein [Tundrisphaera sp. TA3]|uniref:DUF4159 domain-containing protein n=1 Tax=Tundrisphaera sp. TA3 TaxID=3435775 RepID=UPI003EB7D19B